jgi:hypothetical protein
MWPSHGRRMASRLCPPAIDPPVGVQASTIDADARASRPTGPKPGRLPRPGSASPPQPRWGSVSLLATWCTVG